jgi:hypothetical protein
LHGLRRALHRLGTALQMLPDPLRQELQARLREATPEEDGPPGGAG